MDIAIYVYTKQKVNGFQNGSDIIISSIETYFCFVFVFVYTVSIVLTSCDENQHKPRLWTKTENLMHAASIFIADNYSFHFGCFENAWKRHRLQYIV